MDLNELEGKVKALTLGLPPELSASIKDKLEFWKGKVPALSVDEIYTEVALLVRLEMMAYLDRRQYLGMYNRRWAEHKISDAVRSIVSKSEHDDKDIYTLARVNFDLNGLKALNDLGGHEAGNHGLKLFANILNFGATTLWLRDELHLEVTTSAEGGDEFGVVVSGGIDLRPHQETIAHKYFEEVYSADASHLIKFDDPTVREKIELLGITSEIPRDFKFRISTSVGIVLLGEALDRVDISREGATYSQVVSEITNSMFAMADARARAHKSKFKAELGSTNPILSGLYARMSLEVIHLERELATMKARVQELERLFDPNK